MTRSLIDSFALDRPARPRSVRAVRALTLGATAAAASAGFGALARAAARRETAPLDEAVREQAAPPPEHPVRRAAQALAPVGKWYTYVPAALAVAGYVLGTHRGSRVHERALGAAAIMLSSGLAWGAARAFDEWLPQPPAPPGHEDRDKPVFPSGHTMGPLAVGLVTAYVLAREERARPQVAFPIAALLPLAFAGTRLVDEKHWASDIMGGYLSGTAIAALCLAGYEAALMRDEAVPDR